MTSWSWFELQNPTRNNSRHGFLWGSWTTEIISPLDFHLWWRSCLLLSWAKGIFPSSFHSQLGRSFQRCCPLLKVCLLKVNVFPLFVPRFCAICLPNRAHPASTSRLTLHAGQHPHSPWKLQKALTYFLHLLMYGEFIQQMPICAFYTEGIGNNMEERLAGCLKEDWLNLTLWLHP